MSVLDYEGIDAGDHLIMCFVMTLKAAIRIEYLYLRLIKTPLFQVSFPKSLLPFPRNDVMYTVQGDDRKESAARLDRRTRSNGCKLAERQLWGSSRP